MGNQLLISDTASDAPATVGAIRTRVTIGGLGLFVVTFTLCLAAWATMPTILPGWSASVVESGSMAPALEKGDVVVTRPSSSGIGTGAVVVFDVGRGSTVHRVVSETPAGLITQGDANPDRDSTPVPREIVNGVGAIRVPWIGLPALWLRSGSFSNVVIFALMQLGAVVAVAWALPAAKSVIGADQRTQWPHASFDTEVHQLARVGDIS